MDIDELKRQFSASPDDEDLRAKLIIALRRNGRDSEAQELIKTKFECRVSWDDLKPDSVNTETRRHCEDCNKDVYFVTSLEILVKRASKQQCIVAPRDIVNQFCNDLTQKPLPLLSEAKGLPHCMNAVQGKRVKVEELAHYEYEFPDWYYSSQYIPMRPLEEVDNSETLILVSSAPVSSETLARLVQKTGSSKGEVHYGDQSVVNDLREERLELTSFTGFILPPRDSEETKEPPPQQKGLLGWVRRKLSGE